MCLAHGPPGRVGRPFGTAIILPVATFSWDTYQRLLADHAGSSAPRFAYDRGTLEIMRPLAEHEESNRALALLIEVVAEELGRDLRDLGSTTLKREDVQRGVEPDSCFYIRNESRVRGRTGIDLALDSPPDLVVEIDITSPSLEKLPIYAQLGVPEVWRYDGHSVTILRLAGEAYVAAAESAALPPLTGEVLSRFVAASKTQPRTAWLRALRAWTRGQDEPTSEPG